jgi:hypothetical protein
MTVVLFEVARAARLANDAPSGLEDGKAAVALDPVVLDRGSSRWDSAGELRLDERGDERVSD